MRFHIWSFYSYGGIAHSTQPCTVGVVFLILHLCIRVAAPAIVTPGENTTTEVGEDHFRYFQTFCPAFSHFVMIEEVDIVGTCSLYASNSVQHPGEEDIVVAVYEYVCVCMSIRVWCVCVRDYVCCVF